MFKKLLMCAAIVASSIGAKAQTLAADYKGTSNNNPISANIFCADPTALEYNGRLYVYGSNDHQEFVANGKKGENTYGAIKSIVVFSTDDMVNWTFHGTIDTQKICSSWKGNPWENGYGVSWAPSVTWFKRKRTNQEEFLLFFCNSSHGIGELRAYSPLGPWESPHDELLIHRGTSGATPCSAVFDPGVAIDDSGKAWLTFGGLGPVEGATSIQPGNARIVKMKASMIALDGDIYKIPAPYHFEANELNVINGKFVYTYCSNWADRSDTDWNAYKQKTGISVGKPDKCTMCYMVSDDPTNPDSWVYKGEYGPKTSSYNNHSHLQKFQGNYYHIYHSFALMNKMKSANAIDNTCDIYRSICVNKATVNEETLNISRVGVNDAGVTAIKNLNPYGLQQAETMASCGGINYEDYTNIKKKSSISTLGNDASENLQVQMKEGSWINVRSVDFGTAGAAKFTLRAKGTGKVELRTTRQGTALATAEFSSTAMEEQTFDLDATKFQGLKSNLYLVVTAATDFYVDAWQFTEGNPSGIEEFTTRHLTPTTQTYDLSGRRLSSANNHRGVVIEQFVDENGVKHSRKVLSGK